MKLYLKAIDYEISSTLSENEVIHVNTPNLGQSNPKLRYPKCGEFTMYFGLL